MNQSLVACNGSLGDPWAIFFRHKPSNSVNSLVNVAQPLVLNVHQFINRVLVQNTIRRDWR